MAAKPSEDLPASRNSATALPLERIGTGQLPALLAPDPDAGRRGIEFFTAHIRNPHPQRLRLGCSRLRRLVRGPAHRPFPFIRFSAIISEKAN